ncbi:MAG: helix-turn-helix transcriptional regulator [Pseudomonadota bacterium]
MKRALDALEMTQADFARELGLHPDTVGRWCRKGDVPRWVRLACRALYHRLEERF